MQRSTANTFFDQVQRHEFSKFKLVWRQRRTRFHPTTIEEKASSQVTRVSAVDSLFSLALAVKRLSCKRLFLRNIKTREAFY